MVKQYKFYINGKWVNSLSSKTFESKNPATEKTLGVFQQGNEKDVDRAVDAAEKALEDWSSTPAPSRGEILFRIKDLLIKKKEELARTETMEMGKVLNESRGEVQEAIDTFEYMAGEGRRLFGYTTTSELKDKMCFTIRRPIGVCGLITPWNFPYALPSWKLSAALICGNTVVLKPSSDTPLCATKLVEILIEAGVPRGVVNLVFGPGESVGARLVKNPKVRAISFTGHRDTGLWITRNAGLKRLGLEMGSKNPIIVMDDADMKLVVDGILWGGYGTTGQRCTSASRIIVANGIKTRLEKLLLQRLKRLKLGSGLKENTDIGPLINRRAVEKVHKYTEIGLKEGAKLLYGGKARKGKGYFYEPTLFTNVKPHMTIAQEEIFGPSVAIIPAVNVDNAIKIANDVGYGLSSAIYTKDVNKAFKAIEKLETGITYVNSSTIGSEVHLPFGGVKDTGNGTREAGIKGIDEFSEVKTIYVDYSGKLQKAQRIN